MKWPIQTASLFLTLSLLLVSCSGGAAARAGKICTLMGSTSVEKVATHLKDGFERQSDAFTVEVQSVGSSAGITAIEDGTADIAMCSRDLTELEKTRGFTATPIALDGIAVIVHPDNPISGLSAEEIQKIFDGTIQDWSEIGGTPGKIIVVSRESGSGTRDSFEQLLHLRTEKGYSFVENARPLIADGNGSVKANIVSKPRAIGYISMDILDDRVKGLQVDHTAPTEEAILSGDYPLYRPFLFVTPSKKTDSAARFMDYVTSPAGTKNIREAGFIPAKTLTDKGELS